MLSMITGQAKPKASKIVLVAYSRWVQHNVNEIKIKVGYRTRTYSLLSHEIDINMYRKLPQSPHIHSSICSQYHSTHWLIILYKAKYVMQPVLVKKYNTIQIKQLKIG